MFLLQLIPFNTWFTGTFLMPSSGLRRKDDNKCARGLVIKEVEERWWNSFVQWLLCSSSHNDVSQRPHLGEA